MLRNGMRLGAYWTGVLGMAAMWAGVALAQPSAATSERASLTRSITATKSQVDPLACPEGLVTRTEDSLPASVANDYDACRKDPADTRHAIVALAAERNDADLSVDIVIVDIASGGILIHRRAAADFMSTGGLISIGIDTARYDLASGQRAFGIRIKQSENCGNDCDINATQLTLYVQRSDKLHKLLHTWVGEHENGAGPDGVGFAAHRSVTVLCMDGQRSHGLADIWDAERRADSDKSDDEVDIDPTRIPCGSTAPNRTLWRYDGKHYVEVESGQ